MVCSKYNTLFSVVRVFFTLMQYDSLSAEPGNVRQIISLLVSIMYVCMYVSCMYNYLSTITIMEMSENLTKFREMSGVRESLVREICL